MDLSANTKLWSVNCIGNNISALDLGNDTGLCILRCYGNKLSTLDISGTDIFEDSSSVLECGEQQNGGITVYMTPTQKTVFEANPEDYNTGVTVKLADSRFPDLNFLKYLYDNFDTDGSGSLSDSEIADVREIAVYNLGITSMKGVELFTNLTNLRYSV